jgi:DNA-binding NtrC family response regulator
VTVAGPIRRILLVLRDSRLRAALDVLLQGEGFEPVTCAGIASLTTAACGESDEIALVDWTMAEGLLAEEHRPGLRALARRVPMVLIVPCRWASLLSEEDLGVAALLPKPFDADALLAAVRRASLIVRSSREQGVAGRSSGRSRSATQQASDTADAGSVH